MLMKKLLLITILLGMYNFSSSQQNYTFKKDVKTASLSVQSTLTTKNELKIPPKFSPNADVNIVNIIDIGSSVNVSDFASSLRSLWVDPELNTISFYHRMGGILDPDGNASDLGYDISMDGGNTWNTMIRNFYFGTLSGSHPHHGIFNPEGNTNPENAYIVYNMGGSNQTTKGLIQGLSSIGDTLFHIQNIDSTISFSDTISAFAISSQSKVFFVAPQYDELQYQDSLILVTGIWNNVIQNFEYTSSKIEAEFPEEADGPIDIKIAFGDDGETGYITMLGNNGMADQVEGFLNIYPIYWKTTDGGETWTGPEIIQLDGDTGLIGIVNNLLTDQQISELFEGEIPPRREISYTTAFDHDITVDNNDQLHIAVVIGPTGSDPYSIVTESGYIYAMDIHTQNSSAKYCTAEMGILNTFRGTFGEYTEDNRIHITKSEDGNIIFVSWIDTDMPDIVENISPNIWCRGFDPSAFQLTRNSNGEEAATNVTLFSDGMWSSYFATAANIAFTDNSSWNIPFVYASFENEDFTGSVQYKYVTDFSFSESSFYYGMKESIFCGNLVGIEETSISSYSISQNSPNPFHGQTTFTLDLETNTNVLMEVYSVNGKLVATQNYGNLPAGENQIVFKANNLISGVYFFTFEINGERKTGKMIIE